MELDRRSEAAPPDARAATNVPAPAARRSAVADIRQSGRGVQAHAADPARIEDGLWSPERRALTVGLVLTITLVAFEALAVSTVMPIVARELGGHRALRLGLHGVLPRLADRHRGRRRARSTGGGLGRPFAAGLGLFAIGLLIGGLAPSMPVLVAARFIQGLGAGTIPPIAYVAIGRSLPGAPAAPDVRHAVDGLGAARASSGRPSPASSATTLGWRYVFLGLLPLIVPAGALDPPARPRGVAAPDRRAARGRRRPADRAAAAAGAPGGGRRRALHWSGSPAGEPSC